MSEDHGNIHADEYVLDCGRLVGVDYAGNGYSRDDLRTEVLSVAVPRHPLTIAEGSDLAMAVRPDLDPVDWAGYDENAGDA